VEVDTRIMELCVLQPPQRNTRQAWGGEGNIEGLIIVRSPPVGSCLRIVIKHSSITSETPTRQGYIMYYLGNIIL